MQYENRQLASTLRAVVRCAYSVLCILITLAFFGEFGSLYRLRWPLLFILAIIFIFSHICGLNEIIIQADSSYVELRCSPLLALKGHTSTYSIFAERLISYSYYPILGLHYLRFEYVGHKGHRKKGSVGLTLTPSKQRKELIRILKKITETNKDNRKTDK